MTFLEATEYVADHFVNGTHHDDEFISALNVMRHGAKILGGLARRYPPDDTAAETEL